MRTHAIRSFTFGAALVFAAGPLGAQDDAKVTQAIEQLGSKSPAVRARARQAILHLGEPALEILRRVISADDAVPPELLFVIAEDLARERLGLRFALHKDLGAKSWHVTWRPGGQQLALLPDYGATVSMLDAELKPTGESCGGKTAHFAFGPRDRTFAFNNGPGEIVIVERETGRRVRIAVEDKTILAYSPDGMQLATGGYGRVVDLWNVADGTSVRSFAVRGSKGGLTPVFSPDGKLLVVGNRNDKTHVFDIASGEVVHVLGRKMTQQPAFSPDGSLLAIGYVDGSIGIWNMASGTLQKLLPSAAEEVFTLAWSPDGKLLASAGLSGPIVIWSAEHLARLHTLESGSERTFALAFRPDGKLLVAAGNGTTRAWTIER